MRIYRCRSTDISGAATDVGKKVSLTKSHRLLSHINAYQTLNIANTLGWLLTRGGMPPYSACAHAKAKQKNVLKESDHLKYEVNGTRFFIAISTVKGENNGPPVAKKN